MLMLMLMSIDSLILTNYSHFCTQDTFIMFNTIHYLSTWSTIHYLYTWSTIHYLSTWSTIHYLSTWSTIHYLSMWSTIHYLSTWSTIYYLSMWSTIHYLSMWSTIHYLSTWSTIHYLSTWSTIHYLSTWSTITTQCNHCKSLSFVQLKTLDVLNIKYSPPYSTHSVLFAIRTHKMYSPLCPVQSQMRLFRW